MNSWLGARGPTDEHKWKGINDKGEVRREKRLGGERKAEDGGRKAEDGGRMAEDGGQMTEYR